MAIVKRIASEEYADEKALYEALKAVENISQTDWEQNDETAINYIKNRPFYEETTTEVLLEEVAYNCKYQGLWYGTNPETPLTLQENKVYKVTFDGIEYECTCGWGGDKNYNTNEVLYIGNPKFNYDIFHDPRNDTGEPFLIVYEPESSFFILRTDLEGSHTMSLTVCDTTIHQIDPKYIKDMYYEEAIEGAIVVAETTVTTSPPDGFSCGAAYFDDSEPLVAGSAYYVTLNGEKYECVAKEVESMSAVLIGNPSIGGLAEDEGNGEPFWYSVDGNVGVLCTAEVGDYTISIVQKEMIVHKLDEKYIPDTIARVDDIPTELPNPNALTFTGTVDVTYDGSEAVNIKIPEQVQSDWNQADETAVDYVKNRPFYSCEETSSVVYYDSEGHLCATLEEGKTYTVTINGVKYSDLVCHKYYWYQNGGYHYLLLGGTNATDSSTWIHGFILYQSSTAGEEQVCAKCTDSSFNFEIHEDEYSFGRVLTENDNVDILSITGITYKTIDEKYIPDSIARVEDIPETPEQVQPDWNQNDDTAKDYVKNRPFYEEIKYDTIIPIDDYALEYDGYDYSVSIPVSTPLVAGKEYTVSWNGEKYTLTCQVDQNHDTRLGFGNTEYCHGWGDGNDFESRNVPFWVYSLPSDDYQTIEFHTAYGTDTANIGLQMVSTIIHQMDSKYIKDMYYEEAIEDAIVAETTVTTVHSDEVDCSVAEFEASASLVAGSTYHVIFNGEKYECVAKDVESLSGIFIGNFSIGGFAEDDGNGEPFLCGTEGIACVLCTAEAGEYTISIVKKEMIVHKLDEKYLPEINAQPKTLVVTLTENEDGTFTASHSPAEIEAHVNAGGDSAINIDGVIYRSLGGNGVEWVYSATTYNSGIELKIIGIKSDKTTMLLNFNVNDKIPEKLPNPNALTFTGEVTGTYDGSKPLSIEIPKGGGGGSDVWEHIETYTVTDGETSHKTELSKKYKKFYIYMDSVYASGNSKFRVMADYEAVTWNGRILAQVDLTNSMYKYSNIEIEKIASNRIVTRQSNQGVNLSTTNAFYWNVGQEKMAEEFLYFGLATDGVTLTGGTIEIYGIPE